MNKKLSETLIIKYAKKIREIQSTQINEYERMIRKELSILIPSLVNKNTNGIFDWTCDIINCENDEDVFETLGRIKEIEKVKNNWTCKYCNKSTVDVDCEYLFGTDHIECTLKHEQSNITESVKLTNQLSRMQDYITQLESRLAHLEHQYEEPTN
jgi:hypothetical protein